MDEKRRRKRTGALYLRSSDRRWVGAIEVPRARGDARRRRTVTDARFCGALRKLSAIQPVAANPPPPPLRSVRLAEARKRGGHAEAEWRAYCRSVGWVCEYCRNPCPREFVTKDHRVPISRGGGDTLENLALACHRCNTLKNDLTAEEFRSACQPERFSSAKGRLDRGLSAEHRARALRNIRRATRGW